jgi:hypothetical protein
MVLVNFGFAVGFDDTISSSLLARILHAQLDLHVANELQIKVLTHNEPSWALGTRAF